MVPGVVARHRSIWSQGWQQVHSAHKGRSPCELLAKPAQVFLNDDCLLEETKDYTSNHSNHPVKITLSSPVKIKPNKR